MVSADFNGVIGRVGGLNALGSAMREIMAWRRENTYSPWPSRKIVRRRDLVASSALLSATACSVYKRIQ